MEVYVYVCRSVCDYMYRCVSVNVHVRCVYIENVYREIVCVCVCEVCI